MLRVTEHPILDYDPAKKAVVNIIVDGKELAALEGDTVASALTAHGMRVFRYTSKDHEPRGLFCGIGQCTDCVMEIDGVPNVRSCVTTVKEGMRVNTQHGNGTWEAAGDETV